MTNKKDDVKTEEIQISENKHDRSVDSRAIKELFSYLFKQKWQLVLVLICVVISSITQVWGISMLQPIIDNYILKSDITGLKSGVIKMGLIYLSSIITTFIYTRLMIRIGERSIRNIRKDLFVKIQKMPINFFDTNQHGQIMSRFTNDTDTLSQSLSSTLPTLVRSLLMLVGTFIVMIGLSWKLTLSIYPK